MHISRFRRRAIWFFAALSIGAVLIPASSVSNAAETTDRTVRVPVTRDTWFSNVGHEADCNLGGAPSLKLKSIQEMSLIDIDPAPLKGRVIVGADLYVRQRGNEVLRRVTISTFASDWVEGTAPSYEPQAGSSCFHFKRFPDVPWAYPGSDLTAVMLGQGGTIWAMSDASPPDANGWMKIRVDPRLVAARVAGVSQGFALFDDTGSEWTHEGDRFTLRHMPNRFVYSRDGGRANAPYFQIKLGDEDREPPPAPTGLHAGPGRFPDATAEVSWITPADKGPAGTAGFLVEADGKPVPQYLVPAAGPVGESITMQVRDLPIHGKTMHISVRAVDGAGNVGEAAAAIDVPVSNDELSPVPGQNPEPFASSDPLPRAGDTEVAIIDALDKVQPTSWTMIPHQAKNYLSANHLWSAAGKQIRLQAARNEFVSFQILFHAGAKDLSAKLQFADRAARPEVAFYQFGNVNSKNGPVPDPLLPFSGKFSTPAGDPSGSLLCEVYVPHSMPAGEHAGTLTIAGPGGASLKLNVSLTVWNFELPDTLSFIPELNCYGLPPNEADYYRLAQRNRTVINRVPYHQSGDMEPGCAPRWDGKQLDWSEWDKRFGPYLDGSAFSDLPRKGVPLEVFYLPLFENWPTPMEGNYNGSYWADQAFPESYRKAFVECSRQFAEHFNQKHWNSTYFQCFFNGKNNFKEHGWSRGSCPWLLDEPMNFQDFWALRWFGQAFHEGADPAGGAVKMVFRCDVSRPQWQRDSLDGVLNYNVVGGGAFAQYRRLVLDRKQKFKQVVIPYGSSNNPADSNLQPVGWCWDSWTLGADGVLPWQVIGIDASWKQAEDTCLFYPGDVIGQKEPVPSIRLKAYLRGEQDVEYLVLLARLTGQTQLQLGRSIRAAMELHGARKGSGFVGDEDAGVMDFSGLRPQDVWKMRERIGRVLSEAAVNRR